MDNLKETESRKKDQQQMTTNVPPPKPPRLHQQQKQQQEENMDQTPTAATKVMSTKKQSRKKVLHFQSPLKTTINSIADQNNKNTRPMLPCMQAADIVNRPTIAAATTITSRGAPPSKLKDKSLYLPTSKVTAAAAANGATANTKNRLAQGCSSLMYACQQGDTATVLEHLRTKPERIRQRDSRNKSVLHYCAELQQRDLVAAASIAIAAPELLESADEDGFTPLHLAVIQGNLAMVNLLLANKADVNAVDNEGHSVVHWATVCGEVEALRSVLAAGANVTTPDINGGSPLHYAAQMCGANYEGKLGQASSSKLSLEILSILLAHPQSSVDLQDKDGRQPLLWAASAGSAKAVIALVKAGARVESADKDGLTALHCAASRGHTECIDTLISLCGAPTDLIDSNGCTALHYAVTLGHADATSRLLDLEADPNRQDRKGRTPAHCGCSKGQFETVKLLKERGANLWLRNAKGDLPVHEAASSGRRELVEWLLEQRPKQANTTSNDGRSLLHIAAVNDCTDMCKMLLDYGADINAIYRNSKGVVITPLDCALQKAHRSTAKFIQSNGGLPASKLRLSGRRSNPFQDVSTEAVRPLKYAEKEEISDLTNSKKYVVYLKRSDSDNGEGSCSCTEQTYKKEHKYSHICKRHHRSRRHSRRRTSSCGEPKAAEHCRGEPCSDICRSKSNIEIRRKSKSRERYASSSGGDGEEDEDSCENCCYHKKQKHRVIKRRSISTRHSKELKDTDDDDDEHTDDGKKGGTNATAVAESKHEKREVGISEKSNVADVREKLKSTSRPSSKTMTGSRPQSATSTKRRTPTPTQTSVLQAGAIKDGTFIKTPPEASPSEVKPKVDEKFAAVDLTDDEEDANAKLAAKLVTTLVDVHRSADDTQSTASLKLHDEEVEQQQIEDEEQINDKAEATLEERVTEQISKEVDELLAMAATAVTYGDGATVEETQQTEVNESEKVGINGKQESKEDGKESPEKYDKKSIAPPHLIQTPATPSPIPTPTPSPSTATESNPVPTSVVTPTSIKSAPKEENAKAVATSEISKPTTVPTTAAVSPQPTASTTAASASPTFAANTANVADASSNDQQQQQREQESRRSFTLLPSDSGDEEQPIRKSSFQVLKSDESIDLEGEEPDRAQDEHYEEEFSDTQVFKIMPETHAEVAQSSQDEAEEDEPDAHIEDNDDDDYEEASVDDDEDIPVVAGGSPVRRFTSSGNRHGVGAISKTQPPTQTHEYDYSTGRKRRLKKRIRSGTKSRSNWKADNVAVSDATRGGSAVQQQSAKDQDSGFEPSPRAMKSKIPTPRNIYTAHIPVRRPIYATLDGRSCSSRMENRKPGDKGACDMAAVTRSIQRNIRRYYMERKIFQHLLELKSLQIRSNKLNEAVLVKRAVDDYHKSCAALGGETGGRLRRYPYTEYTFKNFELFLYETLKTLQKPGTYNFQNIHEVYEEAERRLSPDYNMYAKALQCTTKTHRCLHAAHAYTGIPCAAYIPMMNHHTMPKFGFGPYKKTGVGSFYLPKILSSNSTCGGKVSLELSHGKNKQLISLPSEKLDSNKRYYVTFTVKESQSALETKQQQPPLPHQQQQQGVSSCTDGATKCTASGQVNNERK